MNLAPTCTIVTGHIILHNVHCYSQMRMHFQSHCPISAPVYHHFHFSCAITTRRNLCLGENSTTLEQAWGNCCGHCMWSRLQYSSTNPPCSSSFYFFLFLIVLFWHPLYSFIGSPGLFKVIYHSWQTSGLYPTFHLFQECCPHMQQPLCIYSFISFLRILKQLLHSCRNWKLVKDHGMAWHCVTWKIILSG